MICLRCGYCCIKSMVIIVKDPKKGIKENNLIPKKSDEICPHFVGEKCGEYSCAVHDEPWYKDSPCFSHGQIEQGNTNCRMGEYLLNNKKDARDFIVPH